MTSPDFDDQRDLAGSDKYLENLLTTMDTDQCVGVPFVIPEFEEIAYVVIPLTGNEIARLVSVVDVGAALLYPDAYHQVYYSFIKGLECSVLCDAIVSQCLSNDGFRQSLIGALAATNALTETAGSDTVDAQYAATILIDFGAGCDDDDRFGGAYAMVDLLNDAAVDMLDIIAALTNQVDVAKALARNIPIIGNVAAFALDVATLAIDIWMDLYAAAFNSTSHDELACAIFCKIDGCEMTLEQVVNAYTELLSESLPPPPDLFPTDFSEVVEWLLDVAGDLTSDVHIVGAFHWLILQVLVRGSKWSATTTRILQIALSIYNPIPPAETCDCGTWQQDFMGGENGIGFLTLDLIINDIYTVYNATEDRLEGQCYPGSYWVAFTINLPASRTVTGVSIVVRALGNNSIYAGERFQVFKDGSYQDGELLVDLQVPQQSEYELSSGALSVYTNKIGVQHWQGMMLVDADCDTPDLHLWDISISIAGLGSNPFE